MDESRKHHRKEEKGELDIIIGKGKERETKERTKVVNMTKCMVSIEDL